MKITTTVENICDVCIQYDCLLKTEKKEQTKNCKGCVADLKSSDIFRESLICLSFEE